jgi:hypothetical protein
LAQNLSPNLPPKNTNTSHRIYPSKSADLATHHKKYPVKNIPLKNDPRKSEGTQKDPKSIPPRPISYPKTMSKKTFIKPRETIITTTTTSNPPVIKHHSSIQDQDFLVFDNANVADIRASESTQELDKENATVTAAAPRRATAITDVLRTYENSKHRSTNAFMEHKDTPSQYYQEKSISRMDLGIAKFFSLKKKPLENRMTENAVIIP